jgi:hypothetical protein
MHKRKKATMQRFCHGASAASQAEAFLRFLRSFGQGLCTSVYAPAFEHRVQHIRSSDPQVTEGNPCGNEGNAGNDKDVKFPAVSSNSDA